MSVTNPFAASNADEATRCESSLGRSIPRREGAAKLRGKACYVDDLPREGVWHGGTVRADVAHARLLGVRFDPRFDWSRVVVVTAADIPGQNVVPVVLRDSLSLTGAKNGCGEGDCGACTALLDGVAVVTCLVPIVQVEGADVRTIEALSEGDVLHPLQQAFLERGGTQCGMCAPGFLMAASAHLERGGATDDATLREALSGVLCRCTGYNRVIEAVKLLAGASCAGSLAGKCFFSCISRTSWLSPGSAAQSPYAISSWITRPGRTK